MILPAYATRKWCIQIWLGEIDSFREESIEMATWMKCVKVTSFVVFGHAAVVVLSNSAWLIDILKGWIRNSEISRVNHSSPYSCTATGDDWELRVPGTFAKLSNLKNQSQNKESETALKQLLPQLAKMGVPPSPLWARWNSSQVCYLDNAGVEPITRSEEHL